MPDWVRGAFSKELGFRTNVCLPVVPCGVYFHRTYVVPTAPLYQDGRIGASTARARFIVQCFPVVEWRRRTEDFHGRSITASR